MAFKFKTRRRKLAIDLPGFPNASSPAPEEALTGTVQDKEASAGEERLARAYDEANIRYVFRHVVGAPKGLPGWKEVDFLVISKGFLYTVEVDSAFTHRGKQYADVLHDAIILNDPELQTYGELYPQVFHVDGEVDLADMRNARQYVKRTFGKG